MTALAPTLQAFFTDRLIAQRRASPHTVAAYRDTFRLLLGYVHHAHRQSPCTRSTSTTSTPAMISGFLDHLEHERGNSVTDPQRPTRRQCTRCSASRRCAIPNTPTSSNACWPSRPNASTGPTVTFLTPTRSTRCSPPPTAPAGSVDAITRSCCSSPSRPGSGSPNSPPSPTMTFELGVGAHVHCTARAANSAAPRSPRDRRSDPARLAAGTTRRPGRSAVPHQPRPAPQPRRRRAPRRQAHPNRSPDLSDPGGQDRHTARAAPHRRDATATRRRRHLHHRALARPRTGTDTTRSTSTPTRPSRNELSPAPPPSASRPAATAHPTHSSPSSNSST